MATEQTGVLNSMFEKGLHSQLRVSMVDEAAVDQAMLAEAPQ